MATAQADTENAHIHKTDNEAIEIKISRGDLNNLHKDYSSDKNSNPLSNILDDNDHELHTETSGDMDEETVLKIKSTKPTHNDTTGEATIKSQSQSHSHPHDNMADYHTDDDYSHNGQHMDTLRWFRMGTDRSQTPDTTTSKASHDTMYDINHLPTQNEQYEDFIHHLRHAASYKAEFDIYQVLAYRAKVSVGQKVYFKPFKSLRGMISEEWSNLEVRWLNSFQRVLCQAIVCLSIQTLGVTAILITQFSSYFSGIYTFIRIRIHIHPFTN